jgi:hypothetical protein
MKKVIKLTESDLVRIVKKVIKEERISTIEDKLNDLVGSSINLIRTRYSRNNKNEDNFQGTIGMIGKYDNDDTIMTPGFWVMSENGKRKGFVMYDKNSGKLIEGDSSIHYTYKPADERSEKIVRFILRYLIGNK